MRMPLIAGPLAVRPGAVALMLILLLAAGLRLLYYDSPLLDAHRWRQVDTATIARYFYEDSFNVFYPQVNWGGARGYVESEFPILPALAALFYLAFGYNDTIGRLLAIVFSLGTIVLTYALARDLLGAPAGRAAAFLLAVSPSAVYFGRVFMPDAPMLFFSVAAVFGFVRYFKTGRYVALACGGLAVALAGLSKLPAVLVAAPILAAGWEVKRWQLWRDRPFIVVSGLALLATAAWYWHAYTIYRETGLTLGLHLTQMYPISVADGPWEPYSKWSTIETLTNLDFYLEIVTRIYNFHLSPAGFALAAIGLVMWRANAWRRVVDLWLLAVIAFILVVGIGHWHHDYYQLPLLPSAALYFGAAAAPAFDGEWLRQRVSSSRLVVVFVAVALSVVGILSFYSSGVIRSHFRPDSLDVPTLQAGLAIQGVPSCDGLMVVIDEAGVNSPLLLYYAQRRGWSLDIQSVSPFAIERLKRLNARCFATTRWSQLKVQRPEVAAYLEAHQVIDPDRFALGTALFDLTQRSDTGGQ